MKIILGLFVLLTILCGISKLALAEKIYVYKGVDQIPTKNKHFFSHSLITKVNQIGIWFTLPRKIKGEKHSYKFDVRIAVKPESETTSKFILSIRSMGVRDDEIYYPIKPIKSPNPNFPETVHIVNSLIESVNDLEFFKGQLSGGGVSFSAKKPPKKLYLDYELLITSDQGEEDLLKGTIEMVRTHYSHNVNPFMK